MRGISNRVGQSPRRNTVVKRRVLRSRILVSLIAVAAFSMPASGGIKVYEDGAKFVEIGGRIQLQYVNVV